MKQLNSIENKKPEKTDFIYKDIRFSFFQILSNDYGLDMACRIVYRSKEAKHPVRWIQGGIPSKKNPNACYATKACKDEFDDTKAFKQWVDENLLNIESEPTTLSKNGMQKLTDILNNF